MTVGGKFSMMGQSWPLNKPYVPVGLMTCLGLPLSGGVGVRQGLCQGGFGSVDCVCLPHRIRSALLGGDAMELAEVGMSCQVKSPMVHSASWKMKANLMGEFLLPLQ